MAQNLRNALLSFHVRLMKHIIKWYLQPQKRAASWEVSIKNSREMIKRIKKKKPSLNDNFIKSHWDTIFETAKSETIEEIKQSTDLESLAWDQVFDDEYELGEQ